MAAIAGAMGEEAAAEDGASADAGTAEAAPEAAPATIDIPPPADEPAKPKDEVESLMDKYDHEEEQKAYEKSPAAKKAIQAKKDKEIEKQ